MNIRRASGSILLFVLMLLPAVARSEIPPIRLVLFTHIEDNTPAGSLPSPQSRQNYLLHRSKLIAMANLARDRSVPWSLQPDWKILQAALIYEDAALMATTNNKNFLRYLKEDLDAIIDPHSHENGGYNYTDVAHLLDSLGVGATTVIGGHVWDPSLPQFQEWDRFRIPVAGERYPWALWRGDILMGSGSPNHVDDPVVSGVWRPRDRDHYFEHDSTANITAIGQYRGTIEAIPELVALYENGAVPTQFLLTSSYHITPAMLTAADGLATIESTVIDPVLAMEGIGILVATDFTTLIQTWQDSFASRGYIHDADSPSEAEPLEFASQDVHEAIHPSLRFGLCVPHPVVDKTVIQFTVLRATRIRLSVVDILGHEVALLAADERGPGSYAAPWDAAGFAGGIYFCRLQATSADGIRVGRALARKLVVIR